MSTGLKRLNDVTQAELTSALGNISDPLVHIPFRRQDDEVRLSGVQSFTRASTATYIDPLDGLVKTAANDTPRFERMADGGVGVLLEGSSTNLYGSSNLLGASLPGQGTHSNTANLTTVDIFGNTTNTAVSQNIGASGSNKITSVQTTSPGSGATSYTYSAYLKRADTTTTLAVISTGFNHPINGWTPVGSAPADLSDDKWHRLTVTFSIDSTSGSPIVSLYIQPGSSNAISVFVDAMQVEALPFASSYIPTTTTAVTRAADNLTLPISGNTPQMTNRTAIFEFDVSGVYGYNYIFAYGGGTRWLSHLAADGTLNNYDGLSNYNGSFIANTVYRVAINSDKKTVKDGVVIQSTTPNPNITQATTSIFIGMDDLNQGFFLYGHIRNFRIYDRALTDAEMALA